MPAADDDSLSWGGDASDPSYLDGARRGDQPTARSQRPRQIPLDLGAPGGHRDTGGAHDTEATATAASTGVRDDYVAPDKKTAPDENRESAPPSISSVFLVVYGIVAGINIFYVFGWVLAFQRETFVPNNPFLAFMYQLGHILAIAAPVVFFATVLLLTRNSRAVVRLGWLFLGILLLAPWPFILSGAVR
ncbi:MAG: hypothetical protein H7248_04180 [Microbacteriaceae bacterium]|nr:hypothetical protein [Microbacteriaceae bacterium]